MKPRALVLVVWALAASCRGAGTVSSSYSHPGQPDELDGKGFHALDPGLAQELRVRRVTTSDWLCEEGGGLMDRGRGVRVEYDRNGRLVHFAGHVDQGGDAERERTFDGEFVSEERFFEGLGAAREALGRIVHRRTAPRMEELEFLNPEGEVVGKGRIVEDEAGRKVRYESLDPDGGEVLAEMRYRYDASGNLVEEAGAGRLVRYAFDGRTLTVSRYEGDQAARRNLHSTMRYTFDERGRLLSYHRASGDGSYWDRFDYRYDERGLPIEKTWSRLELVLQEPYEVTRYAYEHFE